MNMNLLHDITFYVMYAAMAIAIFITIERGIYFAYVRRQARALTEVLGAHVHSERDLPESLSRRDSLPLNMVMPVLAQKASQGSRKDLDDVIETQYLTTRAPLARSLWIIETITTAASFATGLGIAIALFCVVFHNFFQDSLERINDQLKILLIRAATGARVQGEVPHLAPTSLHIRTA